MQKHQKKWRKHKQGAYNCIDSSAYTCTGVSTYDDFFPSAGRGLGRFFLGRSSKENKVESGENTDFESAFSWYCDWELSIGAVEEVEESDEKEEEEEEEEGVAAFVSNANRLDGSGLI